MNRTRWAELSAETRRDPAQRERIATYRRAIEDALRLGELRVERGLTQRAVGAAFGASQANICRIEHEEDLYLSTLRGYVGALGGRLEVRAVFDDQSYDLVVAAAPDAGEGAKQVSD
ncbi:MAG: hypothetical protein AVDCRST_MAG73-54 [uncultured Thermomicrobiales bacterium]|uniref:Uncharacterized protein n=1 Tax=uncultured Thermomicrobiales bacterium TaxID=1645740 RepID=A0A6J4TBA1_9BACT|nr:MAG: hypothetical protein AVDCRST_MAG73-54 [uncultured Thermomicrobiales bacterium]